MHVPLLTKPRQINARGRKRFLHPHICPTGTLALDPSAVLLDERQHNWHRHPARHDDLDASIGMHARRKAPRSRTPAQRPRRRGGCRGVVPIEPGRTPVHNHDHSPMR
jgi:hypothetical protein